MKEQDTFSLIKVTATQLLRWRKCRQVRSDHNHLPALHFLEHRARLRPWVSSKVQYWQLIDIPRLISSYCLYNDICPSLNLYPNLLQLPILHLYHRVSLYTGPEESSIQGQLCSCCRAILISFEVHVYWMNKTNATNTTKVSLLVMVWVSLSPLLSPEVCVLGAHNEIHNMQKPCLVKYFKWLLKGIGGQGLAEGIFCF